MYKIVFKKEYLKDKERRNNKSRQTASAVADKVVQIAEEVAPGKVSRTVKLVRELLKIFSLA